MWKPPQESRRDCEQPAYSAEPNFGPDAARPKAVSFPGGGPHPDCDSQNLRPPDSKEAGSAESTTSHQGRSKCHPPPRLGRKNLRFLNPIPPRYSPHVRSTGPRLPRLISLHPLPIPFGLLSEQPFQHKWVRPARDDSSRQAADTRETVRNNKSHKPPPRGILANRQAEPPEPPSAPQPPSFQGSPYRED